MSSIQRTPPLPTTHKRPSTEQSPEAMDNNEIDSVKKFCTRSNPTTCKICKESCVEKTVVCCQCDNVYHPTCVNMSPNFFNFCIIKNKLPWKCPTCIIYTQETQKTKTNVIGRKIKEIEEKVTKQENKLSEIDLHIKTQDSQMEVALDLISRQSDLQESKFAEYDQKFEESSNRLTREICYIQGRNKIDELLINGIPMSDRENMKAYVLNIAKALNTPLTINGLKKVHRLTGLNRKDAPIVVKFESQQTRDDLNDAYINNMKQRKPLMLSSVVSLKQNQLDARVYINPRIPPCLKDVHVKALELKKLGKIEATYGRVNAIAVRVQGTWHKIHTVTELLKVAQGKPLADEQMPQANDDYEL